MNDQYYRFIFENCLDAILLTRPDGSIAAANPAACDIFQRTEEEICNVGRDGIVDITDPRLKKALSERAANGMHGNRSLWDLCTKLLLVRRTKLRSQLTRNHYRYAQRWVSRARFIRWLAGSRRTSQLR